MSKHTIPTELNIAPRGKSWLHGQLVDGEQGHPTRQSMESAEHAQAIQCTCPSGDGSLSWPCPAHPPAAVPGGWQELAARVMDALADAQDRTNAKYPEHVKCYPTWETRPRHLRWLAEMFRTGKPIGNGAGQPDVLAALAATPAAAAPTPVLVDGMKQELMALYNEILKQGRGMHYWNYAAAVLERYRSAPPPTPAAAAPVVTTIPDAAYCALQYVEHALAAIANREEQVGSTIERVDTIGKASKRAKAALTRLQAVAHHFNALEESPAAEPVALPEPVGAMSATTPRTVAWNCAFMPEAGTRLYTEQQVRALLAGVSAPAAQAVQMPPVTPGEFSRDIAELTGDSPQAQADAREAQLLAFAVSEIRRDEFAAPQAQAEARDAEITWPKARDVGRIGDMSPSAHMRVGFDSDNDVLVSVWDERGGGCIEFCNPGGGGGGQSSRTRMALIALMVAMEADNAEKPSRDWWAQRAAQAAQQGGDKQ